VELVSEGGDGELPVRVKSKRSAVEQNPHFQKGASSSSDSSEVSRISSNPVSGSSSTPPPRVDPIEAILREMREAREAREKLGGSPSYSNEPGCLPDSSSRLEKATAAALASLQATREKSGGSPTPVSDYLPQSSDSKSSLPSSLSHTSKSKGRSIEDSIFLYVCAPLILLAVLLELGHLTTPKHAHKVMQIDGAIIKEQGIVFAIVIVKSRVTSNSSEADNMWATLHSIRDFQGLPIVLALQDSSGIFEYQGRRDIVDFLSSIDSSRIPWMRYTIP
jgi:hypothetical protein